jgi:hypothetical protein
MARRLCGLGGNQVSVLVDHEDRYRIELSLSHEFVHRVFRDVLGKSPAWLNEGIAEYAARRVAGLGPETALGSWYWHDARSQVLGRVLDGSLRPLVRDHKTVFEELEDYPNYPQSLLAVDHLLERAGGVDAYRRYASMLRDGIGHDEAFARAFGLAEPAFEDGFIAYLDEEAGRQPGSLVLELALPSDVGATLIVFPPGVTDASGRDLRGKTRVEVKVSGTEGAWKVEIDAPVTAGGTFSLPMTSEFLSVFVKYDRDISVQGKHLSQQGFTIRRDRFGWFYSGGTLFWSDGSAESVAGGPDGAARLARIAELP